MIYMDKMGNLFEFIRVIFGIIKPVSGPLQDRPTVKIDRYIGFYFSCLTL